MLLLVLTSATMLWASTDATVSIPGGVTMDFVWIAPGTFTMGSERDDQWAFQDEGPAHEVTLTRGYWLGKCEVTQGQWAAVMGTEPWSGWPYVLDDSACPAVFIGWDDCQELCAALTAADGGAVYRLPTEAEWEYACRAGTTTPWSCGADTTELRAREWYRSSAWDAGIRYAQPVGLLPPNSWALCDMHGNVAEWVHDWYAAYGPQAQVDPQGPAMGARRLFRGGCFRGVDRYARSANRMSTDLLSFRTYWIGVRLARVAPGPGTSVRSSSWGAAKLRAGAH